MDEGNATDRFTITVKSAWGDTWTWVGADHVKTQQVYDRLGPPNDVKLVGKHRADQGHGGLQGPLTEPEEETEAERVRWRMTLQELCHQVGATPADLEAWARLGALGPGWRETTENKWRHITRAAATRAVVMRALLNAGFTVQRAATLADSSADGLRKGRKVQVDGVNVSVVLDPETLDLP